MTRPERSEIDGVIELVAKEAAHYLEDLDTRPVRSPRLEEAWKALDAELPDTGAGAAVALRELLDKGLDAAVTTTGPRCYHFVMGGVTPAALGGDWLASALDQASYAWVSSPLGVKLEALSLAWLRDLFGLPDVFTGVMTTGATAANYVGLAAAREWWAERHDADVSQNGFSGLPRVPVFSSGYLHASSVKTLSMLGIGRSAAKRFARDEIGRVDLEAMERALERLDGAPAILIGNAGEVNAGDFDPIDAIADLAGKYNAWLHVDGAFGLFAAASPKTRHLVSGIERAQSITVDGHKWLNVPYDCGFSFVRDVRFSGKAFAYTADYLPQLNDPRPNYGIIGPESSRRSRAFSVWATLRAYGRQGYRELVEQHLALAQAMAARVDDTPDLERLAEVPLNIVCFRYNPGGLDETQLNDLNTRLGEAVLEDGRYYAGTTRYGEKVALRPAMVNWRTRTEHVEQFVDVVAELGARLTAR